MPKVNHESIGKIFWPVIFISLASLMSIYFVQEAPWFLPIAVVPVVVYPTANSVRKKQGKRVLYAVEDIRQYAGINGAFLAITILLLFMIEGYMVIEIGVLIILLMVALYSTITFLAHYLQKNSLQKE